ncbi:MAG: hypothetical protein WDN69_05230 [Aliidongia sp.]
MIYVNTLNYAEHLALVQGGCRQWRAGAGADACAEPVGRRARLRLSGRGGELQAAMEMIGREGQGASSC